MTSSLEHDSADDLQQPALTAKLNPRWAMGAIHVLVVAAFAALFMVLNYVPLRGTDIWGHVSYGKWILLHRSLPTVDPLLPLAEGMRVIDTSWLSQVIFAQVQQFGGAEGLSNFFAVIVFAAYLLLARAFYLQSGRPIVTLIGVSMVIVVGWSRLTTIRPENFGFLCFACLLWLIVSSQTSPESGSENVNTVRHSRPLRLWIGIPILFALWANLHGSFVCGLAVLGCFFLGRVIEVAWQSRGVRAVLADRQMRRWLYLGELAVAATLLNPYGIDLLLETLLFSSNPNLRTVLEWEPLVIMGVGGRGFALSCVLLLVVLRHSRHRVPVAHVLLLAIFAVLVVRGTRMLSWYAPVFGLVLVPHMTDIWARLFPTRASASAVVVDGNVISLPVGRSWIYSLICCLVAWTAFALSPISSGVLGGKPRTPLQLLGETTPTSLTEYLRENPPRGQVFNPQWWGDWLVWDGPEGLRPFVTTNVHLTPRQLWDDYLRVAQARSGWQIVLDRYRVDTVIFDKNQQRSQARAMRRNNEQWRVAYEDRQAIVFVRRNREQGTNDETPDDEMSRDESDEISNDEISNDEILSDETSSDKIRSESREATAGDSLGRKFQVNRHHTRRVAKRRQAERTGTTSTCRRFAAERFVVSAYLGLASQAITYRRFAAQRFLVPANLGLASQAIAYHRFAVPMTHWSMIHSP